MHFHFLALKSESCRVEHINIVSNILNWMITTFVRCPNLGLVLFYINQPQFQLLKQSQEWRRCDALSKYIHLKWYHFLYRLERLYTHSIIFQVLVCSHVLSLFLSYSVAWHLLPFIEVPASTSKQKTEAKTIKVGQKLIHRGMNYRFILIPSQSRPFTCVCNPNCRNSFCLSSVEFVLFSHCFYLIPD